MPMYDDQGRLLVSFGAGVFGPGASTDNAVVRWDGVTGTIIQDSLVIISDVGDVTLPEYIIHTGDPNTFLRFRPDQIGIDVGGVEIIDIIPAGVVWNEGGVDVDHRWEGVGAPNALFIQGSDGKIGIGTNTIPHGGVGRALLALDEGAIGQRPHVQFTTNPDDHPLMQLFMYSHDNVQILFDAYYDGAYKSSDAGSNFRFRKQTDLLRLEYDSGIAQGAVITWNDGIVLDTLGRVFINETINTRATGPCLTINQAGADAEIFTCKSSDVGHGFTTLTEADSYFTLTKFQGTSGGARLRGWKDPDGSPGYALGLGGNLGENADVAKTAAAVSIITIDGAILSGTTTGAVNANGNILGIRDLTQNIAIFCQDGDLYLDNVVNINQWDDYNDAELVRAGRLMMRPDDNPIKKQFMEIVDKYSKDLVKWKLINLNEDDPTHFMMGMKKWVMLNADCNWQNYERNRETRVIVEDHDKELIQLRKDKLQYRQAFKRISQALGIPQKELLALAN